MFFMFTLFQAAVPQTAVRPPVPAAPAVAGGGTVGGTAGAGGAVGGAMGGQPFISMVSSFKLGKPY